MRFLTLGLLVTLTTSTAFVGCIGSTVPDGTTTQGFDADASETRVATAWEDAPKRAHKAYFGQVSESVTIQIPPGTTKLVVSAAYDVRGQGSFTLSNPLMIPQKQDTFQGAKTEWDDAWFEVDYPVPGPWTFQVGAQGDGEYAFGFYFE